MFVNWFVKLIAWLAGIWSELPPPIKEKIIEIVVESFDALLRKFYAEKKKEKGDK